MNLQVPPQSPPDSPLPDSPRGRDTTNVLSFDGAYPPSPLSPAQSSANADAPPTMDLDQSVMSTSATKSNGSDGRNKKHPRKLKKRVTVSKLDAIQFHDKTHGHNKLILLISKFFILLSCVVVSSQFVLITFIIFRDFVLILYSLDTIINIICLWLTFNFSDEWYNKYFCGRCCTKCCFPFIKMIALSCNEYELEYVKTHNMNNKCIGNKCLIYCQCCCGCGCRYGCFCCGDNITPKEIYALAKYEIELMVSAQNEKSITMSQLSSRQSQKDLMVSVVEKQKSVSYKD